MWKIKLKCSANRIYRKWKTPKKVIMGYAVLKSWHIVMTENCQSKTRFLPPAINVGFFVVVVAIVTF